MQFYYHPNIKEESSYRLSEEECRHLIKVLRSKTGDHVVLTDGKGTLAHARLVIKSRTEAFAEVKHIETRPNSEISIEIAIAPMKSSKRWEWFLEKSTELGVNIIQPIFSQNSEKQSINYDRSERILIAATKQAQRAFKPVLKEELEFDDLMQMDLRKANYIAHCREGERIHLAELQEVSKEALFLVGPEGDFSQNEVERALGNNFIPISLGENRLRTETAGIAICQSFNFAHRL
ncbi:MAG: 16S rRNA (uracil(1498)-N(3))-methyltransferase [Bacteroidota bacterium]